MSKLERKDFVNREIEISERIGDCQLPNMRQDTEDEIWIIIEELDGLKPIENTERPSRNTNFKYWVEVERKKDISVIGDSHGCLVGFKRNLEDLNLINEEENWIGDNQLLVIMGDILFDRNSSGFDIEILINKLKIQAKENGGSIVTIKGNHDEWADAFFMSKKVACKEKFIERMSVIDICFFGDSKQGGGIVEFSCFTDEFIEQEDLFIRFKNELFALYKTKEDLELLSVKSQEILQNMRTSEKGRIILEQMVSTKVLEWIDDNLFIHTNPTIEIINYILEKKEIDSVNELYEKVLNYYLLGEGEVPTEIELQEFNKIRDIFLATNNRDNFRSEELGKQLTKMGINTIFHGHSPIEDQNFKKNRIGGVEIIQTDFSAFREGSSDDKKRSIAKINANTGNIRTGKKLEHLIRDERKIIDDIWSLFF